MENNVNNMKGMKILVAVLICIILGLGGFIVYDKLIKDDSKTTTQSNKEKAKTVNEEDNKEIDLTKCLNEANIGGDVKTVYKLTDTDSGKLLGATFSINPDKKSVTLEYNKQKRCNNNDTYDPAWIDTNDVKTKQITGFEKNIKQVAFAAIGQDSEVLRAILFLMEDGTIQYVKIEVNRDIKEENNAKCYYFSFDIDNKINTKEGLANIVKLYEGSVVFVGGLGDYHSMFAATKDGSFYDLGEFFRD